MHDFYLDNYSNEMAQGVKASGTLANALPGLPNTLGQNVEIYFQNAKSRPLFKFASDSDHELAVDQRAGIDHARHHQFLELCGYFNESDAKQFVQAETASRSRARLTRRLRSGLTQALCAPIERAPDLFGGVLVNQGLSHVVRN